MSELLKKCLVEFIGTFFLVLTVALTVFSPEEGIIAPIAIGLVLMVMVYAGGGISGAHYNPAVSLAAAVRGALEWKDILPYWGVQLIGGGVAALLASKFVVIPEAAFTPFCYCAIITFEFLFTFALCYVVLHTATSSKTSGNSYFGLAIGSTVTVGAFATAGLCYGAFNPAVAFGLSSAGAILCGAAIVIAITNLIAGALAGWVYKIINND